MSVTDASFHPTITNEDDYEMFKGGGEFASNSHLSAWLNGEKSKETILHVTKKEPNWGKGESLSDRTMMDCVYAVPGKVKPVFTFWEFVKGSYLNVPEGITQTWEYEVADGFVSHITATFGVDVEISVEPYGVGVSTKFSHSSGFEEETSHTVTHKIGESIEGPREVRKYQEVQLQVFKIDGLHEQCEGTPAVDTGISYKESAETLITQGFPDNHHIDEVSPWVGYVLIPVYTGRKITKTGDNRQYHVTYDQAKALIFGEGMRDGHWHISHWD